MFAITMVLSRHRRTVWMDCLRGHQSTNWMSMTTRSNDRAFFLLARRRLAGKSERVSGCDGRVRRERRSRRLGARSERAGG